MKEKEKKTLGDAWILQTSDNDVKKKKLNEKRGRKKNFISF